MDKHNVQGHISGQFNAELEHIRNQVLAMGGLVEQQLNDAINAIHHLDMTLAAQIIKNDQQVNAYEVAIDQEIIRIIARRQPAASDLRLVFAISKMVADLERIGDSTKKLAQVVLENIDHQPLLISLENLGRQCSSMLNEALDAFARMDAEQAFKIHRQDEKIDRQYECIIRQLMTFMMADPRSIPAVIDVMWAARALERIGDRTQNISEYVIYFVRGEDVRHLKPQQLLEIMENS